MSLTVIGLDPGTTTGFAVWNVARQRLAVVCSYPIHRAMNAVRAEKDACGFNGSNLLVMFEDARKSRIGGGRTYGRVARLQGVGAVKRDCAIWQGFLEDMGVPFIGAPPIHGGTKWDTARFQMVTGWTEPTNEHGRDAACRVIHLTEPQVAAMIRESIAARTSNRPSGRDRSRQRGLSAHSR